MTKRTCKIPGCAKPVHARGMCGRHYNADRLARITELCIVPGCTKTGGRVGRCEKHYSEYRDERHAQSCSVPGCSKNVRAKGLCMKHYDAERRAKPAPKCEVDGCEKKSEFIGLCGMHYQRHRKFGDVHAVKLVHNDPDRRFRESYDVDENGCWVWNGWLESNGYARFSIGQERWGAHRWAYERFVGPIPAGLVIDHLCRNRACVNPEHLEAVTQQENILRGVSTSASNARKTHCKRGHKLSGPNLVITSSGTRQCRVCRNAAARRYQTEKRLLKAEKTT